MDTLFPDFLPQKSSKQVPLSPADKVPEKAKPLADNPPVEDKVYAVVKKVKKKEVTPSDIVLRHIQPPSLRSSSGCIVKLSLLSD